MCSQASTATIRRMGLFGSHPRSSLHFFNAPKPEIRELIADDEMKRTWQEFCGKVRRGFKRRKLDNKCHNRVLVEGTHKKRPPRSNESLVLKWAPNGIASSNGLTRWRAENNNNIPSRVLLILVKGSRESLSSRTTFVLLSKAGSIRVNFIICPGNHDGGPGRAER